MNEARVDRCTGSGERKGVSLATTSDARQRKVEMEMEGKRRMQLGRKTGRQAGVIRGKALGPELLFLNFPRALLSGALDMEQGGGGTDYGMEGWLG